MNETTDAKGREVFTVHPQILAGGAQYRRVPSSGPAKQTSDPRDSGRHRADQATDIEH